MTVITLRPNNTYVNTFTLVGAGSAHAATSDDSDSSYIEAIYPGYSEARLDFNTYTLAGNQFVKSARLRIRYVTTTPGAITLWYVRLLDQYGNVSTTDTYQSTAGPVPVTAEGAWHITAPDGQPWAQGELDSIQIQIFPGLYTGNVQMPRIFEVYFDVDINTNPQVVISAPTEGGTVTTTTRPATIFSYSDADGDQMEAYRVKIYSDTEYSAGGFDPNTSTATFDTGKVYASAPPIAGVTPNVDLLNGHAYRSYAWVYQVGAPNGTVGNGVSPRDWQDYTIAIVSPSNPSITATADQPNSRVQIVVTPNSAADPTKTLTVERSVDTGATWAFVRGGKILGNTATTITLYDYEMPPNIPVIYRARNIVTIGGSTIAGDYSASTIPSVTINTQEYLLKDPFDPTRNMVLTVLGPKVDETRPEDSATFAPLGRTRKVVIADSIKGVESTLELDFVLDSEFKKFEALRNAQRVLLLVRGWTNEQWYIRFGPVLQKTLYNYNPPYRTVTIGWIEVDPSVVT